MVEKPEIFCSQDPHFASLSSSDRNSQQSRRRKIKNCDSDANVEINGTDFPVSRRIPSPLYSSSIKMPSPPPPPPPKNPKPPQPPLAPTIQFSQLNSASRLTDFPIFGRIPSPLLSCTTSDFSGNQAFGFGAAHLEEIQSERELCEDKCLDFEETQSERESFEDECLDFDSFEEIQSEQELEENFILIGEECHFYYYVEGDEKDSMKTHQQLDDNEEIKKKIKDLKTILRNEYDTEDILKTVENVFLERSDGEIDVLFKSKINMLFEEFLVNKGVKSYGEIAANEIQNLFVDLFIILLVAYLIKLKSNEFERISSFKELKELVVGHYEAKMNCIQKIEDLICNKYAHVCYGLDVASNWNKFMENYFFGL